MRSALGSATIQQDHVQTMSGRRARLGQNTILRLKQDHVLPMSGRRARLGQHTVLQLSEEITYSLWAIEGRDEVSTQFCNYLRRSHTSCGRSVGETRSAHGPATIQGAHILPGGDRRAGQGQHTVLQLFNEITYSLWAIERRNEVSTRI